MKCGDCKHYTVAKEDQSFGYCDRVDHAGRDYDANDKVYQYEKAVVIDGSGYQAALLTKADFGCVLWEVKT